MRTHHRFRIGAALVLAAHFSLAHAADLKIGDAAPKLKVDRWLKGTPVPRFEKGKVYVIEFWATWCGPCKVAMPHLSSLSKKYAGKATFVGVNIWEDQHANPGENLDAKVNRFVKGIGDAMAYNVCVGSKDGYMTKNWMEAASQGGIPATFVVDQDSKIAWIGHPYYLEEPLSKIIERKFDAKAFAAEFAKQQEEAKARQKIYEKYMAPIKEAMAAKKYAEAVAAADKAIAEDPLYRMAYAISKFEALLSDDPEKAFAEAVRLRDDWDQAYMAASSSSRRRAGTRSSTSTRSTLGRRDSRSTLKKRSVWLLSRCPTRSWATMPRLPNPKQDSFNGRRAPAWILRTSRIWRTL